MKNNNRERMRVELIDKFISDNNITIEEFCIRSRVEKLALEKMYNNDYDFDIIYLFRVCKMLGIEMKDFFIID